MKIADQELNVPAVLAPNHLTNPSCDRYAIMTYLSGFRQAVGNVKPTLRAEPLKVAESSVDRSRLSTHGASAEAVVVTRTKRVGGSAAASTSSLRSVPKKTTSRLSSSRSTGTSRPSSSTARKSDSTGTISRRTPSTPTSKTSTSKAPTSKTSTTRSKPSSRSKTSSRPSRTAGGSVLRSGGATSTPTSSRTASRPSSSVSSRSSSTGTRTPVGFVAWQAAHINQSKASTRRSDTVATTRVSDRSNKSAKHT